MRKLKVFLVLMIYLFCPNTYAFNAVYKYENSLSEITVLKNESINIVVNVTGNGENTECILIAALYDDKGKLKNVIMGEKQEIVWGTVSVLSLNVNINEETLKNYTLKTMLWSSDQTIRPVAPSGIFPENQQWLPYEEGDIPKGWVNVSGIKKDNETGYLENIDSMESYTQIEKAEGKIVIEFKIKNNIITSGEDVFCIYKNNDKTGCLIYKEADGFYANIGNNKKYRLCDLSGGKDVKICIDTGKTENNNIMYYIGDTFITGGFLQELNAGYINKISFFGVCFTGIDIHTLNEQRTIVYKENFELKP